MSKTYHFTSIIAIGLLLLLNAGLYASGEIHFTSNQGQLVDAEGKLCPDVQYLARTPGADLFFRTTGFSYVLAKNPLVDDHGVEVPNQDIQQVHRVDLVFDGANPEAEIFAESAVPGHANYYLQHCPEGVMEVLSYEKLIYKNLYDKIDLVVYSNRNGIKYDFVIAPGGDPAEIQMKFLGADGLSLIDGQTMVIQTSLGEITETIPLAYQEMPGQQAPRSIVQCSYQLQEKVVSFSILDWDSSIPLVIDPVSTWATFFGGSGIDYGRGVANDVFGYQAGETGSANLPSTVGAHQTTFGGNRDAYLVKWSPGGARIWATYYGGTGRDVAEDVALDGAGNACITGYAGSGFPTTTGAFQPGFTGREDGFLVKFNAAGVRQWATYLGGTGDDRALDVATDGSANIVVAGFTDSNTQISTAGVVQTARSGNDDAFVMKFDAAGSRLWGSYFGGSRLDEAHGVTCDGSENVILAGRTYGNFPVGACCGNSAFQTTEGGGFGDMDMFITKLNPAGTTRLWSTYYGGSNVERAYDVEVDAADNVIVTGNAWSGFPSTFGTVQPFFGGGMGDAAVVKMSSTGSRLWATYLGGSSYDLGFSVDAVGTNDIIIGGETQSFFSTFNQCQTTCSGTYCGFLVHLDGNGANVIMSTVLGGSGTFNSVLDVSVDASSNIFTTGFTTSTNYPVGGVSVFQPTYGGGTADAFFGIYNGDSCNAVILPSEAPFFSGELRDGIVHLFWESSNEISTDHFVVERGLTPDSFQPIHREAALGKDANEYSLEDREAQDQGAHRLYYRIRSVNDDGAYNYSNLVEIAFADQEAVVYPNPANNHLNIRFPENTEQARMVVSSVSGKTELERFEDDLSGNEFQLDIADLPAGLYFLNIQTDRGQTVYKIVKY